MSILVKEDCYFCQTTKDRRWKHPQICQTCYENLFEIPSFEKIFGDMGYGDHWLLLGTMKTGKTNVSLWFFKHTPLRTVWFQSISKVDATKQAEIVLTEKDIPEKFQETIENPLYKKILIHPSKEFARQKKNLSRLYETICNVLLGHRDIVWEKFMLDEYNLRVGIDIDAMANVVLMNDELMDVTFGARDSDMTDGHWSLQHKGRNVGLSLFSASQRNQDIPKMVCNLSMDVLIFKLKQYDIHALRNAIEHVAYAECLPRFHFIHSSTHKGIHFYKPIPLMLWS